MSVAVVLSTRNRADRLPRALAALEIARSRPGGEAELVVIDNGSSDATAEFLARWAGEGSGRHAARVEEPGKSRALNTYVRGATAELLAFTDDDADVAPDWLASMVAFLRRRPEYQAATGPILPPPTADAALLRRLDVLGYKLPFRLEEDSEHDTALLIGANMIVRRAALARVGLFDERLGPGALGFCDDDELGNRMRLAGMRLGYNPAAPVYHDLDGDRLTLAAALERAVCGARSDLVAYRQRYGVLSTAARLAEVGIARAVALARRQPERAVKKRILLAYHAEVLRSLLRRAPRG